MVQVEGHPAVTRESAGSSPAAPATLCVSSSSKASLEHAPAYIPEELVGPTNGGSATFGGGSDIHVRNEEPFVAERICGLIRNANEIRAEHIRHISLQCAAGYTADKLTVAIHGQYHLGG